MHSVQSQHAPIFTFDLTLLDPTSLVSKSDNPFYYMAELKKWEMAVLAGIILIVPLIIVFQLTQHDIDIEINPTFANGCNSEGTVCTYNMDNTVKVLTLTEDEQSWRITGNCVDTVLDQHNRRKAVLIRDEGFVTLEFPSEPEKCLDLVIFDKDDWNRENIIVQGKVNVQCITAPCDPVVEDFELNIFTLNDVATNEDTSNFIERFYGN